MVLIFLCLISLSIMLSRSIRAATKGKISLFFYGQVVSDCVNVPLLFYYYYFHSSTDGYLDCCQILSIVNNAAMNIGYI